MAGKYPELDKAVDDLFAADPGTDGIEKSMDTIDSLRREINAKTGPNAGMYGTSSIIGKAKNNLFEFPVFMSDSISFSYATAVNVLLEQMYANYLQMAISMNPVATETEVREGNVFSRYRTDNTGYLEYDLPFYCVNSCSNTIVTEAYECKFDRIVLPENDTQKIMEYMDHVPLSEFAHYFHEAVGSKSKDDDTPISAPWTKYTRSKKKSRIEEINELNDVIDELTAWVKDAGSLFTDHNDELSEAEKAAVAEINTVFADAAKARDEATAREKDLETRRVALDRAQGSLTHVENQYRANQCGKEDLDEAKSTVSNARKDYDTAKKDYDTALRSVRESIKTAQDTKKHLGDQLYGKIRDDSKHVYDTKTKAPVLLDESKIQKLNTMKPLMMTVNVKVIADSDKRQIVDNIDYIVGVKTYCRVVKATVLPEVVAYPTKNVSALTRYAKWRAGEIRFIDYLFSRPEKKQAAYDSRDPDRKWYHRLYTLAHSKGSKFAAKWVTGNSRKKNPEGLIPNATIVMTKEDVDNIKLQTKIDLMKPSAAKSFCKELFLMALVIVDKDGDALKVLLPDIHNDYDVQSLASIQRQRETLESSAAMSREINKIMRG